ncbi:hypothetical protein [Tautonia sociabilis]|uniref:Uncharacterized protein n=1 Tax=Tautonia sociabilis TaxID=2080755 RepID=A0A432MM14_9BACT|nr:hypothetical protein [Tautonia sociabilis]RUL88166.1 hypothetical protein TsocGM_08495 [Tautonia sociabilis]
MGGQNNLGPKLPEAKDTTEPTPKPEGPPERGVEPPAPGNLEDRDLTIRGIRDALKDDAMARKLEELTGMDREEMAQFVERFSGPPEGAAREGSEVEVVPEEQQSFDPNRSIPDPLQGVRQSQGASRARGPSANDGIGRNRQGGGAPPPPQLLPLLEAYQRRISGSDVPSPAPSAEEGGGARPSTRPRP